MEIFDLEIKANGQLLTYRYDHFTITNNDHIYKVIEYFRYTYKEIRPRVGDFFKPMCFSVKERFLTLE